MDLSIGEVKKRRHSENRFQSPKSVRKSINSLMDLIRCNATSPANCKWITLTYREEMTDCKRVFKDNKAFLRKLRSYLRKQKMSESKSNFKFIAVPSHKVRIMVTHGISICYLYLIPKLPTSVIKILPIYGAMV